MTKTMNIKTFRMIHPKRVTVYDRIQFECDWAEQTGAWNDATRKFNPRLLDGVIYLLRLANGKIP